MSFDLAGDEKQLPFVQRQLNYSTGFQWIDLIWNYRGIVLKRKRAERHFLFESENKHSEKAIGNPLRNYSEKRKEKKRTYRHDCPRTANFLRQKLGNRNLNFKGETIKANSIATNRQNI
jgi:hypothetical protein